MTDDQTVVFTDQPETTAQKFRAAIEVCNAAVETPVLKARITELEADNAELKSKLAAANEILAKLPDSPPVTGLAKSEL